MPSTAVRKPFIRKKEVVVVYPQRNQDKAERCPMVGDVMIPKPAPDQQRNNQPRMERPVRKFTKINMTLSQVLPHLLRSNLVTLKEVPKNPIQHLITIILMPAVHTALKVLVTILITVGL